MTGTAVIRHQRKRTEIGWLTVLLSLLCIAAVFCVAKVAFGMFGGGFSGGQGKTPLSMVAPLKHGGSNRIGDHEQHIVMPMVDVPESAMQDVSYFADAVFIGNSRTQGFQLYSGVKATTYFATKGLSVSAALNKRSIDDGGVMCTVPEALSRHSFAKVYVMLGINEAGLAADTFYSQYSGLVSEIKAAQPNAVIYLQSVLPVSAARNARGDTINNANINGFNQKIRQIAQEQQVYYLDVAGALSGGSYVLPGDASSDGVHLGTKYVALWRDYLLSHTVPN